MIVAIIYVVFILFLFLYLKKEKDGRLVFGLFWLTLIWFISFLVHFDSGFVASDEVFFSTESIDISEFKLNRSIWIAINMLVGVGTEEVILHMRCLNLLTVLLLYIYCTKEMSTINPLFLALLMSYCSVVASLNLRDNLLLFGTLLLISRLRSLDISWKGVSGYDSTLGWSALLVLGLRPLQLAFAVATQFRIIVLVPVIILSVMFLQTSYGKRYFYNYSYYSTNFATAFSDKSENINLKDANPTATNISYWSARFLFAPDPYSSVQRVFVDDDYVYGKFDLLVRAFHRVFYFSIMLWILFQCFRHRWLVVGLVRDNHSLLKFVVIYTFVYAVFNSGGSHERIKLMIYMILLLLLDYVKRELDGSRNLGRSNYR